MRTWITKTHTIESQKRAIFTGEGAYHGSTKSKLVQPDQPITDVASEGRPTTLEKYLRENNRVIGEFDALFSNNFSVKEQLRIPSQDEVRDDGVTFCWCPFDEALREAGPLTREVLDKMQGHITGRKRYVYIDSKIQYFEPGDLPVDSKLWHIDGSIAIRDSRAQFFSVSTIHDMRARFEHDDPPLYLAYQSSSHSATRFVKRPLRLRIPELMKDFNQLDAIVRAANPQETEHPAGAVGSFDGRSLHSAVEALDFGWRLWLRCTETDVEVHLNESILECYGTVFQRRDNHKQKSN